MACSDGSLLPSTDFGRLDERSCEQILFQIEGSDGFGGIEREEFTAALLGGEHYNLFSDEEVQQFTNAVDNSDLFKPIQNACQRLGARVLWAVYNTLLSTRDAFGAVQHASIASKLQECVTQSLERYSPSAATIATQPTNIDPTTGSIPPTTIDPTTGHTQSTDVDPTTGPTPPTTTDPTTGPPQSTTTDPTTGLTQSDDNDLTTGPTQPSTTDPTTGHTQSTNIDPTTGPIPPTTTNPTTGLTQSTDIDLTIGPTQPTTIDPTTGPTQSTTTDPTTGPLQSTTTDPTTGLTQSDDIDLTTGPTPPATTGPTTGPTQPSTTDPTTGPTQSTNIDPTTGPIPPTTTDSTTGPTPSTTTDLTTGLTPSANIDPTTGPIPPTTTDPTTGHTQSTDIDPTTGPIPPTTTDPTTGHTQSTDIDPTTGPTPPTTINPTTGPLQSTTTDPTTGLTQSNDIDLTTGPTPPATTDPTTGPTPPATTDPTTGHTQSTNIDPNTGCTQPITNNPTTGPTQSTIKCKDSFTLSGVIGGSVTVEMVKCVTLGPPEAGKTQLKRALSGNKEESKESTAACTGAAVIVDRFLDKERGWELLDKAKLQAALRSSTIDCNTETPSFCKSKMEKTIQGDSSFVGSQADINKDEQTGENRLSTVSQKFHSVRATVLHNMQSEGLSKGLNKVRIIHFIDSGGQPAFFDLHPVVATSRAKYLFVYDAEKGLTDQPKLKYRKSRSFPTKELPNPNESNLDMIERSLFTLHHCKERFVAMEAELDSRLDAADVTWASRDVLPITIVGSRGSQKKDEDTKKMLESQCQHIPTWKDVEGRNVHFVESLDIASKGVEDIREAVSNAECKFTIHLFPLKWFYCQLIFWSTDDEALSVLSYSTLQDLLISGPDRLVADEEEFLALLTIFHILGLFSCPDLQLNLDQTSKDLQDSPVFTNPDVLYQQITAILEVPFRSLEDDSKLKLTQLRHLERLQNEGILTRDVLASLGIPDALGSFPDFHSYLWKYLKEWGLAVEQSEKELFIPSVLPPRKEHSYKPKASFSFALTIIQKTGPAGQYYHIPQGLFPHFVVNTMKQEGYDVNPNTTRTTPRCRDVLVFKVRKQFPYNVHVVDKIDFIAVYIDNLLKVKDDDFIPDCRAIKDNLKGSMEHAYCRLYKKDERASEEVAIGCECECRPSQEEEESPAKGNEGKSHFARLDVQCKVPLLLCLSPENEGYKAIPFSDTCKAILDEGPTKMYPSGTEGPPPNEKPKTIIELFEQFKEEFLQDGTVPARNIAQRLCDEWVIPHEIQTKIMNAECDYDAASRLYKHITAQANEESAKKLFNIMIKAEAYQKMNDLGRRMLDALHNIK